MGNIKSRNVYLENNINCYEKISRLDKAPFWGITPNILNKLKSDNKPFVIKFIWEGKGGIVIDEADLEYIIRTKNAAKSNGDYKIHLADFDKQIKGKWNNSLSAKIK